MAQFARKFYAVLEVKGQHNGLPKHFIRNIQLESSKGPPVRSHTILGTLFSQMFLFSSNITGGNQVTQAYRLQPKESLKWREIKSFCSSTYRGL
jgi:hypothetical protein